MVMVVTSSTRTCGSLPWSPGDEDDDGVGDGDGDGGCLVTMVMEMIWSVMTLMMVVVMVIVKVMVIDFDHTCPHRCHLRLAKNFLRFSVLITWTLFSIYVYVFLFNDLYIRIIEHKTKTSYDRCWLLRTTTHLQTKIISEIKMEEWWENRWTDRHADVLF